MRRASKAVFIPLAATVLAAPSPGSPEAENRPGPAPAGEQAAVQAIESRRSELAGIARQIWEHPELGYREEESSALLQSLLGGAGFEVEAGVAALPTAFVASYGAGAPVVALLAEFDALPGMSQTDAPEREPRIPDGAGHACGHHLFGPVPRRPPSASPDGSSAPGRAAPSASTAPRPRRGGRERST